VAECFECKVDVMEVLELIWAIGSPARARGLAAFFLKICGGA
jgi:hypothetical protein